MSGARTIPRYPSRTRRRPLIIAVVAVVAAVGIGWLLWAASIQSRPAVSGAVHVWKVDSSQKVSFTLTVQRPDPSVPASCRVIAQASDFETVGEKTISVGVAPDTVVDVTDTMRTIRLATSVSLDQCWTTG